MNPKDNPQGVVKGDICTIMPRRITSDGWKLKKLIRVQVITNPRKDWGDQRYAGAKIKILEGSTEHPWNGTRKAGQVVEFYVDCLQPERDNFPIY